MARQLDFGYWLRRARREGLLSQREMAAKAGLSKSALARYEMGQGDITASALFALLGQVGYWLCAVREDGSLLRPFDTDGAKDLGGRRYPSHRQVFRTMRGEFADYWWCHASDDFFAVTPSDARELPPQGRRRPAPRTRRSKHRRPGADDARS